MPPENIEVTYSTKQIDELLAGITQGEWVAEEGNFIAVSNGGRIVAEVPCQGANDADVPFITASPALVRQLRSEKAAANSLAEHAMRERLDMKEQLATAANEVTAVLESLGNKAVRMRQGGGPEAIYASLAISVAKLSNQLAAALRERDGLSVTIETCHKMLDQVDDDYEEGTTSLTPLDTRLREYIWPEGTITDDMVNGDD